MAQSEAFSTQETHGSEFGSYTTKDEHEVLVDRELDASTLSTQRLDSFFANENFKSNSPSAWGQTSVSTATKNMEAQLQAFDEAFDEKGKSG